MTISYLLDCIELLPSLASRLHEERNHITPELTLEWRIDKLRAHLNRKTLPIAWVAHEGVTLLGMASLRRHDLDGREELSPWLGGVYVVPERRGMGIGTALCRLVEVQARGLGFQKLFLFTLEHERWYATQGWISQDRISCRGCPGVIMHKSLMPLHVSSEE